MAGTVHLPFYATTFRGDAFEQALCEVAPAILKYGAQEYGVRRSREDPYRFLLWATFEDKDDFDLFWAGPEMIAFRTRRSGWFQVPVVYEWYEEVAHGARPLAAAQ